MRLAPDEGAAVEARRFAREWSTQRGLSDPLVADLELVVTELVSNAVRHGEAPISLDLDLTDSVVRGEVRDGSDEAPAPNPNPDHHGGFGLNIVSHCTSRWGSELLSAGEQRKQVWFEIDTRNREAPPFPSP